MHPIAFRRIASASAVCIFSMAAASASPRAPIHSTTTAASAEQSTPLERAPQVGFGADDVPDTSACPAAKYVVCVKISKGTPADVMACAGKHKGAACYPYPGTWTWSAQAYKGMNPTSDIAVSFNPNPGNPSIETISTTLTKPSARNAYSIVVTSCNGSSECGTGTVGVTITKLGG